MLLGTCQARCYLNPGKPPTVHNKIQTFHFKLTTPDSSLLANVAYESKHISDPQNEMPQGKVNTKQHRSASG